MRQILLDTETTGLNPEPERGGHRIVEIAALEMKSRNLTGASLHYYLNPEREIDAGAIKIHGLQADFLASQPRFADIAEDLVAFIEGAELIAHNSAFDIAFLNAELARVGKPTVQDLCPKITDTLSMARERFPGKSNKLDALCERFAIDKSARTLHGALIDTDLLAQVYLALTRGQDSLMIEAQVSTNPASSAYPDRLMLTKRPLVLRASEEEMAEHSKQLEKIEQQSQDEKSGRGKCLWLWMEKPTK